MPDAEADPRERLVELLEDMPVAMLTTVADGRLRSVPMARQEVKPSVQMWFITARDTDHVRAINAQSEVALTFSSRDTWVSLRGRAIVVDDQAKLAELWNTFAEAWLPGGPEDPNATLLRVDLEEGEYWTTPGGRITSLISFAKTRLTGNTYDAEHDTVQT